MQIASLSREMSKFGSRDFLNLENHKTLPSSVIILKPSIKIENLIPFRGACTHTTGPGWWVVDLEDDYIVNKVWIKNRIDCCSDRIDGVKVI